MVDITLRVFRVWQRQWTVYQKTWLYSIVPNVVEPVLFLLSLGLGLGHYVQNIEGLPYLQYIAPGLIASAAMFSVSYENTFGSYVRMVFQKTFDAMIATPVSADEVALGEILWGATKSVIYGTVIFVMTAAFGLVKSWGALLIPVVLMVQGVIFASLALTCAALAPKIDTFNFYFTLVVTPLFVFSGIFFPISDLPSAAQWIAWLTPLVHTVRLNRGLVLGNWDGLAGDALWLLAVAAAIWPLPVLLLRRRLLR